MCIYTGKGGKSYGLSLLVFFVEDLDVMRQLLDDLLLVLRAEQVLRSRPPAELVELLLLDLHVCVCMYVCMYVLYVCVCVI